MSEIPVKPRRKKVDVPIHQSHQENARKTTDNQYKISRKHLTKENARLAKENEEILLKFNELEDLSVRKILKLKEKVHTLQSFNEEITGENSCFKAQIQELLSTLEQYKTELHLNCRNCTELQSKVQTLQLQNETLRKDKKELDEDLNMLKTVVYRLNLQMERYQDKLRRTTDSPDNNISVIEAQDPGIFSKIHQDHSHTPISWGRVNVHTLGPLLDAYQDTVAEKDEIIQKYEVEMSNFQGRLKEIVRENENLQKMLTEDDECSARLKIQIEKLNVELKEVKEQNDVLIKKCAMKQDKLEEVLKCYETKVEQLKRDYTVLHDQYCRSRTEIAALKEKNKALIDAQDDFKNERHNYIPISVHKSSVDECKKWYEELKQQYEQEKSKLKDTIESQTRQMEDLKNRISIQTKEKDDLENKIKQLEKQIKKYEAKTLEYEHALSEAQYSRSACKKQLNKTMNFAKDLVTEQETLMKALNHKQQENKAVKKIGTDMATRMDSLRNQLQDVQRDAWQELSTVEKRIQDQDETIEQIKREHAEEIEKLRKIIKEQQEENLVLNKETSLPMPHYLLFRDKHNN